MAFKVSKAFRQVKPHNLMPRNAVLWRGDSRLTGDRILLVATGKTSNAKIGPMIQLWIIPDRSPIAAIKDGGDAAVCGDCKMRGTSHDGKGRACYVEWWRAVENIWQGLHDAVDLRPREFAAAYGDVPVRVGAYGDPTAVPRAILDPIVEGRSSRTWTAYTHQWRKPFAAAYQEFCMASVDTPEERVEALALGWRTFRVRLPEEPLMPGEIACPHEANHDVKCARCSLCTGNGNPEIRSVAIVVHGSRGGHETNYRKIRGLIPLDAIRRGGRYVVHD